MSLVSWSLAAEESPRLGRLLIAPTECSDSDEIDKFAITKVPSLGDTASLFLLALLSALALAELTGVERTTSRLGDKPIHLWSDSMVTLGWIQGHPSRWKTYVANRVSEIQTTLPNAHWHHVATQDNPVDCASRGVPPSQLANHTLWWRGPAWASDDVTWEAANGLQENELPERREKAHVGVMLQQPEEPELLTRFSSLHKLLRISAWCRRWLRGRSGAPKTPQDPLILSCRETDQSLDAWIRVVQTGSFKQEVKRVLAGKELKRGSLLIKLNPFLDEQNILRVGGRIKHSLLSYNERHPIILPKNSALTALLVKACHSRALHGGVQQTLGLLRQQYWVPGGRTVVKRHIHRCHRCLRWRAATSQQIMGNLPEPRVTPSRPFQHTGVDYAGPVWLRTSPGRGHKSSKAFIAVFVCLSTKAVHLEIVSDYTADAFLAALRRFISRRGLCEVMYSDCGTNFVGAEAELRAMFAASSLETRRITKTLAEERIRWQFNPPATPHFGGLWEAAVKSLKHHLRRVLGDSTLTYEEMATLLSQVEACLNSRPLLPLSDDPEDVAALTPGHFLIGTALVAVPEPTLGDTPVNRLSRWQHVQQMREHFWHRWSQEYLHSLSTRPKWWRKSDSPEVGQLCLVRNEITPSSRWPLARISALHPGEDGQVRVVTVKTATAELTRPLVKIVLLPVNAREEG